MKITIEHFKEKFTYEGSDYLSTSELIERKGFLETDWGEYTWVWSYRFCK
jgi:hypothetical protein